MWRKSKEEGLDFETGKLKGRFQTDGPYRGIQSLTHKDEGLEWVGSFDSGYPGYGIPPGVRLYLLSLYHYLGRNVPHGVLGRNMPSHMEVAGNALQITLNPVKQCRATTVVKYTFVEPETLDMEVTLTAHAALKDLEICLSSYTVGRKWASPFYYLSRQPPQEGRSVWAQPQDTPFCAGWYHSSPRDNRAAAMLYDGRWPGEPYQLHITGPYFRLPILVSRNPKTGFAFIQMAEHDTCGRVGSLYSSDDLKIHVAYDKDMKPYFDPDLYADYSPTYFYFFGETFKKGETRTARYRMMLTRVSEDLHEVLELYKEFAAK